MNPSQVAGITPIPTIETIADCAPGQIPDALLAAKKPVVLKGLVKHWPVVKAAAHSAERAFEHICGFYNHELVNTAIGNSDNEGAIFYNEDLSGFTYQRQRTHLNKVLEHIRALESAGSAQAYYVDSVPVDFCLPGFRAHNDLDWQQRNPRVSIWMGNKTRVSIHHDIPDNIACVVTGKRRFTLFPPEQLPNLYIGPLDFNPAGPAISMVDLHNPDWEKFPRFREALAHARMAELEPGDAIFIPSLWWHQVDGLESFNVLVNYWWSQSPDYLGSPLDAFNHALMNIKTLPEEERRYWKAIFDHYIFAGDADTFAHIPAHRLGVLGPFDEPMARRMRSLLLGRLNR